MQVYNLKPPSPDIVQAYEALDTLPTSVLKQVVVPWKAMEVPADGPAPMGTTDGTDRYGE